MNFDQPEFDIQSVKFRVNKLNALDGFRTMEKIRKAIADAGLTDSLDVDKLQGDQDAIMRNALSALMGLEPASVESVRADLFPKVEFKTEDVKKGYMPLNDHNLDMAFANLPTTAIYEVLIRAIAVNFMDCFSGLNLNLAASS